jgi:hypothetical protein
VKNWFDSKFYFFQCGSGSTFGCRYVAAMLGQTWHEFTILDGMGEVGGAVEVTVAASEAFAGTLVPFAQALNCMTQGTGEWRMA